GNGAHSNEPRKRRLASPAAADYPLGRDVELLNVRVRNLRCTCIDSTPATTQTSTASIDR
ncbi:MAG TPA: hypothetical protein VFO94_14945, partial [Gammaproteobacteria bacterium]|nr:hypothetical protein [Gammaproteobacteria bacterium]